MSAGPAATARSADTKEIGFPGPFFTHRREIAPRRRDWQPVQGPRRGCRSDRLLAGCDAGSGLVTRRPRPARPSAFRSSAITGTVLECADGDHATPETTATKARATR